MVREKKRRKQVFDKECERAYTSLLGFETFNEARANVPKIAKNLHISAKAVGGYLVQAHNNPRVAEHLMNLGYLDDQIPSWFAWPEDPPTPPEETSNTAQAQPISVAPSEVPPPQPFDSRPPDFSDPEPKLSGVKYLDWWWRQPPSIFNELDMSRIPPGYTLRNIEPYDWQTTPKKADTSAEDRRKAEDNKKVENEAWRKFNDIWAQNFIGGNIRRGRDQTERNRRNARDFIEVVKEMPNLVKRLYPPPPKPRPAEKVTFSLPTIFIPPPDEVKKLREDIEVDKKEVRLTLLKAVVECRREKDERLQEKMRIYRDGLEKMSGMKLDGTPIPGSIWDPDSENYIFRKRRRY